MGLLAPLIDGWHKLLIDSYMVQFYNPLKHLTYTKTVAPMNASSLLWVNMKLAGWPNKASENRYIASSRYNSIQLAEHTL